MTLLTSAVSPGKSKIKRIRHIDGLVKDCSNSSGLAVELLQTCTKPLIWLINKCYENMLVKFLAIGVTSIAKRATI